MYQIDSGTIGSFLTKINKTIFGSKCIVNSKDILEAIESVYRSPQIIARLMKGRSNIPKEDIDYLLRKIAEIIYDYFNNPNPPRVKLDKSNYNEFFYHVCYCFLKEYNELAKKYAASEIEYGIAQKLINVSFKYLSCFSDYSVFSDLFKFCHMPIDSYVLKYFDDYGIIKSGLKTLVSTSNKGYTSISAKYNGHSWSKLTSDEYKKLYDDYSVFFDKKYSKYSYLHCEFYIWNSVTTNKKSPAKISPIGLNLLPGTKKDFHF